MSQLRQLQFRLFRVELDLWLFVDRHADMSHADLSERRIGASVIKLLTLKFKIIVPFKMLLVLLENCVNGINNGVNLTRKDRASGLPEHVKSTSRKHILYEGMCLNCLGHLVN